ncbi:MAG: class 1 fructose-bisphosphatase [Candidatus Glassbacteria bacterium]
MDHDKGESLTRHIMLEQRKYQEATGDFSAVMNGISLAAKIISSEVNKAGLIDILGLTGKTNVQGEEVQKLDEYANATVISAIEHTGHICVMASEELADPIEVPKQFPRGKYVVMFDPLDGSSNIEANVSIGTIFSMQRKVSAGKEWSMDDLLQKGENLVAAGYIIYGSSTVFVYSAGKGVHGFTLDPNVGEFLLSHPNIRIPEKSKIYSVNEGNYNYWDEGVRRYIDYLKDKDPENNRPYSSRYIGSLVADFHRNLLYGGIFLYPADKKDPKKPHGKLRLLYEANPLAFIVEQAGGAASTGWERILEVEPTDLHQRVPLIIGSREDVRMAEEFIQGIK